MLEKLISSTCIILSSNWIFFTFPHFFFFTVEYCSHKCNPSRLWSIFKSLNGKSPQNQPITFSTKTLTSHLEIATVFAKQFTSIVPHTSYPSTRIVKRDLLKKCPLDNSTPRFTLDIVAQAIIKSAGNSNSTGPDGVFISSPHKSGHPMTPIPRYYLTRVLDTGGRAISAPPIRHCRFDAGQLGAGHFGTVSYFFFK